jgi:arylsulfatase A-like enzyme
VFRSPLRPLVCLALLAVSAGCSSEPARRPDVLLIVVDTLRADRLGAYGSQRGLTPFLDRFASEGVVLGRAYAPSSWTLPSVATLFTSRHASRHGVVGYASPLRPEEETLGELFAASGYSTFGYSANFRLAGFQGWAQGFEVWEAPVGSMKPGEKPYLTADRVRERVLAWLGESWRRDGPPCFVYLQLMDPHSPYDPPEPFASRFGPGPAARTQAARINEKLTTLRLDEIRAEDAAVAASLYDGEVGFVDHELEQLFAELATRGFLEDAVVVVTADHGEEFREHGNLVHGFSLYEESVRVPWLVQAPGLAPRRVDEPVSLLDLAPTLLELAGLAPGTGFEGRSLVPLLRGDVGRAEAPVLLELWPSREPRDVRVHELGLVQGSRKLLRHPKGFETLFDLARDPGEREPASGETAEAAPLREALARVLPEGVRGAKPAEPFPLSEERKRELKALGYLHE